MRKFSKMILMVFFLSLVSCSKDETIVYHVKLSEETILLSSEKSSQEIKIDTNAKNLEVLSSSEWITASNNNSTLKIEVSENTETNERKGWVLVIAESKTAKLNITQSATESIINIKQSNVEVDIEAGEITFDILTNSLDWKAETSADWLVLDAKNQKYELDVKYSNNTDIVERSAEIKITLNDKVETITIVQKAVPYFVFPSFDFASDPLSIKDFEKERKNRLTYEASSKWYKKIEFKTRSELFTKILYEFDTKQRYNKAVLYGDLSEKLNEFTSFLEQNDFKKDISDSNIYYNENELIQAEIKLDEKKVIYTSVIKQTQPFTTFGSFPYGINKWYATKSEILDYEKQHNGVLDEALSKEEKDFSGYVFNVSSTSNEDPFSRVYGVSSVKKTGLHSMKLFFKDTSKAFFKAKDNNYYLTNEFKNLVSNEGFRFLGTRDDGYHLFVNSLKNTNLLVRASQFKENNYEPVLELFMLAKDRNQP